MNKIIKIILICATLGSLTNQTFCKDNNSYKLVLGKETTAVQIKKVNPLIPKKQEETFFPIPFRYEIIQQNITIAFICKYTYLETEGTASMQWIIPTFRLNLTF